MLLFKRKKAIGYYSVLGFAREPFATSPDPEFFYPSKEHEQALTNLLIELRLRRGLSVLFGDVGTGKTTLSRKLLHELSKRRDMIFHMILNPAFENEKQFLISLIQNFRIPLPQDFDAVRADTMGLRDLIERFLITQTLERDRTIILVIDEAQKLDAVTLESLRVLLNFETNDVKLIQIVLMGQLELYGQLTDLPNFMDRISFKFTLNPLNLEQTKELIGFRLTKAGWPAGRKLFLDDAVEVIQQFTGGYPRKINFLCHKILKKMVADDQSVVDKTYVLEIVSEERSWNPPARLSSAYFS